MSLLRYIYKKAVLWGEFFFRHVILVFIACLPATMISVFLWRMWEKGASVKLLLAIISFVAIGLQLMAPVVIAVYLPIALILWRLRFWPITFPLVGAMIAVAAGALIFGSKANLLTKDGISFYFLFIASGALTALFHYAVLQKTEAIFPSISRKGEDRKSVSRWVNGVILLVIVCAFGTSMFQAFAPKKVKESCFKDIAVTMGEHKLVVPRKYYPPKNDRGRPTPSIQSSFYSDEEWKPMPKVNRDCRISKLKNPYKIFVANMKISDPATDIYGPAWYQRRENIVKEAKDKTNPPEYPALVQTINSYNGKTLYVLPVNETAAANRSPVIIECTPPLLSEKLKEKTYKGLICYTNYRHPSGLQIGYKIPYAADSIEKLVRIDLAMQRQVQAMVDAGEKGKRKVDLDFKDVPFSSINQHSECKNTITFSISGRKYKTDMDIFQEVSLKDTGSLFKLAGPMHDCSIEDVGEVKEIGGRDFFGNDSFTLTAIDKKTLDHYSTRQVPAIKTDRKEFTGRVNDTFKGASYMTLPLDEHPTLDGQPVQVRCMEMQKSCHVRYMHPLGFWVTYIRKAQETDPAASDLAVRQKINDMIEAAKQDTGK